MRPSILVLGGTGLLGRACVRRLGEMPGWTVAGTQRQDRRAPLYVDLAASSTDLEQVMATAPWDYVINATGMLRALIDGDDPESVRQAIRMNATVPYEIATIAGRVGSRVIHVSTDAVFGPSRDEPYDESSPACPADVYGYSKALGECSSRNTISVRCSIVGRDPVHARGLVEWLLAQPAGAVVPGFTDYTWSVATATQFAGLCAAIVAAGAFDHLRTQSPVFHFAPNDPISKYDFLKTLADVAGRHVGVKPTRNPAGPVRRTLASRYDEFRALAPPRRPWEDVLAESLASERIQNLSE